MILSKNPVVARGDDRGYWVGSGLSVGTDWSLKGDYRCFGFNVGLEGMFLNPESQIPHPSMAERMSETFV